MSYFSIVVLYKALRILLLCMWKTQKMIQQCNVSWYIYMRDSKYSWLLP